MDKNVIAADRKSANKAKNSLFTERVGLTETQSRLDFSTLFIFSIFFAVLCTIAVQLNRFEEFSVVGTLNVNERIDDLFVPVGESIFIEVNVIKDAVHMWSVESSELDFLHLTLTLIRPQNTLLVFSQGLSASLINPFIFHESDREETLILEVTSFRYVTSGLGSRRFSINSEIITDTVSSQVPISVVASPRQAFISKLVDLVPQVTYEIIAFETEPFERSTFHSIVQITGLDGVDIIKVVQGTPYDRTGRVLFTPQTSGPFLIECISESITINATILVRPIQEEITKVDIVAAQNGTFTFPLFTQLSTVLEMDIEADVEYTFTFDFEIEADQFMEPGVSFVGISDRDDDVYDNPATPIFSDTLVPGISARLYDRTENRIVERSKTKIEVNSTDSSDEDFFIFQFDLADGESSHKLVFNSFSTSTVLLDVIRFNPEYKFSDIDNLLPIEKTIFGNFSFTVETRSTEEQNKIFIDETNVFPCDIGQAEPGSLDLVCEDGIILYCRNEFFPGFIINGNSTRDSFADICECVDLLCATLSNGADLQPGLRTFLNYFNLVSLGVGFVGTIIYIVAHLELVCCGGFSFWVRNEEAFLTWTLVFLFLVVTSTFTVTEIALRINLSNMQDIADSFFANDVNLFRRYYDGLSRYYYREQAKLLGPEYAPNYFAYYRSDTDLDDKSDTSDYGDSDIFSDGNEDSDRYVDDESNRFNYDDGYIMSEGYEDSERYVDDNYTIFIPFNNYTDSYNYRYDKYERQDDLRRDFGGLLGDKFFYYRLGPNYENYLNTSFYYYVAYYLKRKAFLDFLPEEVLERFPNDFPDSLPNGFLNNFSDDDFFLEYFGNDYLNYLYDFNNTFYVEVVDSFLDSTTLEIAESTTRFNILQKIINTNIVTSVFRAALAVMIFLDIAATWISSSRRVTLNRVKREKRNRRFKLLIRWIEFSYFIILLGYTISLIQQNGRTYNLLPNFVTLVVSIFVIAVFSIGRTRISASFEQVQVNHVTRLNQIIRKISAIVIVANISVIIVQCYKIINVGNLDALLIASNDPVAQMLFFFQDICILIAILSIFFYLLKHFLIYRETLFVVTDNSKTERIGSPTVNTTSAGEGLRPLDIRASDYTSENVSSMPVVYSVYSQTQKEISKAEININSQNEYSFNRKGQVKAEQTLQSNGEF